MAENGNFPGGGRPPFMPPGMNPGNIPAPGGIPPPPIRPPQGFPGGPPSRPGGPPHIPNIPLPGSIPMPGAGGGSPAVEARPQPPANKKSAWTEHKSPDGRIYFYNTETKQSSWEKPDDLKTPEEKLLASCPWKQYKSDTGKVYFHNKQTGDSSWTKPKDLEELEKRLEASKQPSANASSDAPKPVSTQSSAPSSAIQAAMAATLASIELPPLGGSTSNTPDNRDSEESEEEEKPKVYVFKTKKEAIEGFKQLLRDKAILSNASWETALAIIKKDARFTALKSLNEKKQHYNAYKSQRAKEEKEEARLRVKKAKEDLEQFLLHDDRMSSQIRYRKAEQMFEGMEDWRLVPERDRKELFDDVCHQLAKQERERAKEIQKRNRRVFTEILESMTDLNYKTQWSEAQQMLLENEAFTEDRDLQNMDKEDALMCFEEYIRKLEAEHDDDNIKQRQRGKRQQRKNREAFLVFLDELHEAGKLSSISLWVELYPLMREDIRFSNMLGQAGSTPLDLFKFYVEDLKARFHEEKKMVKEILKEKGFIIEPSTKFDAMAAVVFSGEKGQSLDQGNVKMTYQGLIEKAEAREKERLKEEARRVRKLEKVFESMLRNAEPPVEMKSEWGDVRSRFESLPAFQAIVPESERIRLFQEFQKALEESCLHKHSKKKKKDKKHKRPRDRSPSDDSEEEYRRSKKKKRSRSASESDGDRSRKHKKKSKKKKKSSDSPSESQAASPQKKREKEKKEVVVPIEPRKEKEELKRKGGWDTSEEEGEELSEEELEKKRQRIMQKLQQRSDV